MDAKETFTACLGMVLAAGVLLSPAACVANRHNQITKAIEAGADPLEAKCAIEGETEQTPVCILAASRKPAK